MFERIKELKYRIWSWAICALLCFLLQNIFQNSFRAGIYDAADYWGRGEALWTEGRLNLLGIDGFRGYVFPLFLGTCNHYAGQLGWRLMNAAMISSIFTIIVPSLGGGRTAKC